MLNRKLCLPFTHNKTTTAIVTGFLKEIECQEKHFHPGMLRKW